MHATVCTQSLSLRMATFQTEPPTFDKIIKSDGKIAPNHLPGKVCLCQRPTGFLYEIKTVLCTHHRMKGSWSSLIRSCGATTCWGNGWESGEDGGESGLEEGGEGGAVLRRWP